MKKLYSVHEITALLNEQMAEYQINYRFTEDRVRARLRYAQGKGEISPKHMLYDKRASFYTTEDLEILRRAWIGAMIPEDGVPSSRVALPEDQELEVRRANTRDAAAIVQISSVPTEQQAAVVPQLAALLRGSREQSFIVITNTNVVVGWAHASHSIGETLVRGTPTGIIFLCLAPQRPEAALIASMLIQQAQKWFTSTPAQNILVHLSTSLNDIATTLQDEGWQAAEGLVLQPHNQPESDEA